jgi:preprotein translocase subunit SecA
MIISVRDDTVRGILTVVPREKPVERVQVVKPTDEGFMKLGQKKVSKAQTNTPVRNENKVGRNDPCPCGSGKKFKNCHGRGM